MQTMLPQDLSFLSDFIQTKLIHILCNDVPENLRMLYKTFDATCTNVIIFIGSNHFLFTNINIH